MSFAERRQATPAAAPVTPPAAAPVTAPTAVEAQAPPAPAPAPVYVGLVTRALAFALDAALIQAVAILSAAVVTLALSIVTVPEALRTATVAAGGVLYVVWTVGYFVTFWATTGQTPGSRVFGIRVQPASGETLAPRRALLRFVGLTLAAIPLFAGFIMILYDDRRRGLHDRLARTVVIEADDAPEQRRSLGSRLPPA